MNRNIIIYFLVLILTAILIVCGVLIYRKVTTPTTPQTPPEEHIHTFGEWQPLTEPSCGVIGENYRECIECGEREYEEIPALEHDFQTENSEGTECEGYIIHKKCANCGKTQDVTIPGVGHSLELNETGSKRVCKNCDYYETVFSEGNGIVYYGLDERGNVTNNEKDIVAYMFGSDEDEGYTGSDNEIVISSEYKGKPVIKIDENSLASFHSLEILYIPSSITIISAKAFNNCSKLKQFILTGEEGQLRVSKDGRCLILNDVLVGFAPAGITNYEILSDDNIKSISSSVFASTTEIETLSIADSVTSIGENAFSYSNIKNIEFGEASQLKEIGNSAFCNCYYLVSINLPENIESIGYDAFYFCSSLENIVIPKGLTKIEESVFSCCFGLKSVVIPAGVISIESSAFMECSGLTTVIISYGVTSIGVSAFENCRGLKSIVLPASVQNINSRAFSGCLGLKEITLMSVIPPIIQDVNAFPDNVVTIYIPKGSFNEYKSSLFYFSYKFVEIDF